MTRPTAAKLTQALLWSAEALETLPIASAPADAIDHGMTNLREMQVAALNEWWRRA